MTRIIAGRAKGHRLRTPDGARTRPTSDRVREALFSSVESWCGSLSGLRVLDLYAGSGAVGLEAWSRGAAAVTLVEHDKRTADLVRDNVRALRCADAAVRTAPVAGLLAGGPGGPAYDLVFSDPPYPLAGAAVDRDLALLVEHGWLAADALVVVERASRAQGPTWPEGFEARPVRRYGETSLFSALWYGPAVPDDAAGEED